MKNIALFGGTFNPVHNGHINMIKEIDSNYHFDKIIIMPTFVPPHKIAHDLACGTDRYNMCRLAFENIDNVVVSNYELQNGGKSYTYLTLSMLKEKYPSDNIFLIIGSDMFLTFDEWKNYTYILKNCKVITVCREKNEYDLLLKKKKWFDSLNADSQIVDIKPYVVSSTMIRDMVRHNENCSCYLNNKVVKYISENKLYL